MRPRKSSRSREHGVALVTTVIVVAVLAVVAVAMMQSTTIDRFSARSVSNYYRARLAADAGLAAASAVLATNTTNDTFIVVANTNGQLFVGNGSRGSTDFSYTPIFSTVSNLSTAVSNIVTAGLPLVNVSGGIRFTNQLPGGLTITSPPVSWVNLTNASGQTNARFAYWVEDLGGRLDLSVVGTNDATVAKRPTGTNAGEIALWSLFNPSSASDPGNATAAALTGVRSNLLTAATARLVSGDVTTNQLADLAVNLRHDTNEPEVIPFGLGYADEGKAKYNLNTNINAAGVTALTNAISRNLPNFGARGGAMNPADYVNNVAASIVDYADSDDTPTVDDPDNPTYIGIENIPWPNELFDRITFDSVTTAGLIRILLKDYVEVWNMGSVRSAETTISMESNYDVVLTFSNTLGYGFTSSLKDMLLETGAWGPRDFLVPSLAPNEYKVVDSSTDPASRRLAVQIPNPSYYSTTTARAAWRILVLSNTETRNLSFTAKSGGKLIQKSKGGRWPRYLKATTPLQAVGSKFFIFCNPIGFASQTTPSSAIGIPAHSGGDPRAQYFLSDPLRSQNYLDESGGYASPGGRNWEKANIGTYPESEVNPAKFWPDNGHAADADLGWNATSYSAPPTNSPKAPLMPNWVMLRNDTGQFSNVCELGNIYDPMQWADQSASPVANQPGLWTNLTTEAKADPRFGGRNTLRVGRWEFSKFTKAGSSAWQFLDIFAAGTNTNGVVANRIAGRININTAGTNALRALAAGVTHLSDEALQPGGTGFVVPVAAVSNFLTGVFNRRAGKPFASAAELAALSTNAGGAGWPASAVFGNTNLAGVTEWNDAAAEEWFGKVYPLATVRSRNFLVHVVGQALMTNGTTVLSSARKTFQICVEPVRATNGVSAGLTTNSIPRVYATWDL